MTRLKKTKKHYTGMPELDEGFTWEVRTDSDGDIQVTLYENPKNADRVRVDGDYIEVVADETDQDDLTQSVYEMADDLWSECSKGNADLILAKQVVDSINAGLAK